MYWVAQVSGRDENIYGFDFDPGYKPTRPPRLLTPNPGPPPLPRVESLEPDGFGAADEDGLRMLAALETLTSLEPDFYYSEDPTAEASVTIVETAGAFPADVGEGRPLRRPIEGAQSDGALLLLNGYETFLGSGDEAIVEIVEVSHNFDTPEQPPPLPRAAQPSSLVDRLASATGRSGRFFKALSGS